MLWHLTLNQSLNANLPKIWQMNFLSGATLANDPVRGKVSEVYGISGSLVS